MIFSSIIIGLFSLPEAKFRSPATLASILIMDDEDDVMQVMRKGLEMVGFEVNAKCNPLDALAGFKAGAHYMGFWTSKCARWTALSCMKNCPA